MHPRSACTLLVVAGALLVTGLTAPPATAATPRASALHCGAVVTKSVRLAADLVCAAGDGITVAADGVEVNLNGHALTGPGASAAQSAVGVRIRARDVVVRNGTVRGWPTGVLAGFDPYGEPDEEPASAVVRQTRLEGNGTGALVRRAGAVALVDAQVVGNGLGGSSVTGGRLSVRNSTADRNGKGFSSFEVGWDGLVLDDSTVRGSAKAAVSCSQDGHVVVQRSTLQRNGTGVDASQCSVRVSDSEFRWNTRHTAARLVDFDTVVVSCSSFSRDGGPLAFVPQPCGTTGRVSGTIQAP